MHKTNAYNGLHRGRQYPTTGGTEILSHPCDNQARGRYSLLAGAAGPDVFFADYLPQSGIGSVAGALQQKS
jgi:hypothetical protein